MTFGAAVGAIELQNVVKRYPIRELPAVDGLSLSIPGGQFVALMGPSGSGKSTLLNLVGALDEASEGHIEAFGSTLDGLSDQGLTMFRRHTVGFVFQTFHLIPALNALENVMTPMIADRRHRRKTSKAMEALGAVGLEGKEAQLPGTLSGGEQQRVAIARALVMEPRLLLADEPTGNLDAKTGDEIMALIKDLHVSRGMTVLLATHDPAVALRADRVIGLIDGVLVTDLLVSNDTTAEDLIAGTGSPRSD